MHAEAWPYTLRARPMRESPGSRVESETVKRRLSRRRFFEGLAGAVLLLGGVTGRLAYPRLRGRARSPALDDVTPGSSSSFNTPRVASPRPIATATRRSRRPTTSTWPASSTGGSGEWVPGLGGTSSRRFVAYASSSVAPLREGLAARFSRLPAADQDRVLAATEASSSDLLRAGFDGLKSLCLMGYYRDPRAWSVVGYDGPLVGRPASGWSGR